MAARLRLPVRLAALVVLAAAVALGFALPSGPHAVGWEGVVAGWLHVTRGSAGDRLADMLIELGSERVVAGIAAGLAAGLAASGRVRVAVAGFTAVLLGAGGGELSKAVIGRRIGAHAALAYPSGHTAGAAALATTIVLVLAPGVGSRIVRAVASVAAVMVGTAVGLAMVAKGHHYPADVLGGLGFGVGVPSLVLGGFARDTRAAAAAIVPAPAPAPAPMVEVEPVLPAPPGPRPAVPATQRFGVREEVPADDAIAGAPVAGARLDERTEA